MKRRKFELMTALATLTLIVSGCGGTSTSSSSSSSSSSVSSVSTLTPAELKAIELAKETAVFNGVLPGFNALVDAATATLETPDRYVKYAQAEAMLLDSAVINPTTTQGGNYAVTRIIPKTVPYTLFGTDNEKLKRVKIAEDVLTSEAVADFRARWASDRAKLLAEQPVEGTADLLTEHAITLQVNPEFKTTYSAEMTAFDYLATHHASNSEVLVNLVDGLIEFDVYGQLVGALASSWSVNEDYTEFTFTIREGAKWVTNAGEEYATVKADDFVAGMQHLLDAQDGLEYLVDGVIVGAHEYLAGEIPFSEVGVTAVNDTTLKYTLEKSTPYFLTMLEYNPFMPLNRAFFVQKGGAFGIDEYAAAKSAPGYGFGIAQTPSSILYNGAFVMSSYAAGSQISLVKNANYWDAANTTLSGVKYVYDNGSNPDALFTSFKNGEYSGLGVSNIILERARTELGDSLYVAETNATTYYGTWNLDRETYEVGSAKSNKTEQQKVDTKKAILNKNFRKAIQAAWNRSAWNALSVGQDLANNNLRNTLTAPEFVSILEDYSVGGEVVYTAGTTYGEIVDAEYKKLNPTFEGSLTDGVDAFYDADAADVFMAAAKTELEAEGVTFPIHIDIVYASPARVNTLQASSFKQNIQSVLGVDNVYVNLMEATTLNDYYYSGYYASIGSESNFDFFYGSGWGPDYGDPQTYVNIFRFDGDMMTVIGIDGSKG